MRWLRAALLRLFGLFEKQRRERDLAAELDAHLQAHIDDNVRAGMTPADARRDAILSLGGVAQAAEIYRDRQSLPFLETTMRDFRYALRMLRRAPGFSLAAVGILAVTIGANAAVYTLVDRLLVRPLPYPQADRLGTIIRHYERGGRSENSYNTNGATWLAMRGGVRDLDVAVAAGGGAVSGVNLTSGDETAYVRQQRVSSGFFRVLGVPPALGREFTSDEDQPGGPSVVVLSHSLWARVLGGDPNIVGRAITLRGEPFIVIGVMPDGFHSNAPADVWTPLRPSTQGEGGGGNYSLIARLRPGARWTDVEHQVDVVGSGLVRDLFRPPPDIRMTIRLVPWQQAVTRSIRQPLLVLWAAVLVVLLIGCVNIAGLLLARSAARAPEIATRMAIGGGRAAIVRQLLVESLALAACGAIAGIGLGYALSRGISGQLENLMALPTSPDLRVLLIASAAALGTSVVFGLFPALHASRTDVRTMLIQGAGGIAGPSRRWPTRMLVVSQVALGIVLVVGAGLLLRTFNHLTQLRSGVDATNVVTGTMSLQDARYRTSDSINTLFAQSIERIGRIPGVEHAAVALSLPYERALNNGWQFDGEPAPRPESITFTYVTPDYFRALRIPVLGGRVFDERDTSTAPLVVAVNDAFVRQYSRDGDPLGRRLKLGGPAGPALLIVGVVGAIQQLSTFGNLGPVAALPGAYVPSTQFGNGAGGFALAHTWFQPSWIVRTNGPVADHPVAATRASRNRSPADVQQVQDDRGRPGRSDDDVAPAGVAARRARRHRIDVVRDGRLRTRRQLRRRTAARARRPDGARRDVAADVENGGRRRSRPHVVRDGHRPAALAARHRRHAANGLRNARQRSADAGRGCRHRRADGVGSGDRARAADAPAEPHVGPEQPVMPNPIRSLSALVSKASTLLGARRRDRQIADELASHVQLHVDDNLRAGMTLDEARRDALVRLGGLTQASESWRDQRHLPFLEKTMQDIRYALRMLKKTPGFAAAAILTLALGIGANTAIFSVLNAVILKPLEYQQPDRLMKIATRFPDYDEFSLSPPEFIEFRAWARAFSSLGAYRSGNSNLSAADRPERVRMMQASDDLFTTLRVSPLLGRTFDASETRPGGAPVAVLSETLWRSSFGGNPNLIGTGVDIDGVRRTIVGIMPRGFDVADLRIQLWLPLVINSPTANRGGHGVFLIGRLADGVTLPAARAELQTLLPQWYDRAIAAGPVGAPPQPNRPLHTPNATTHPLRIDPLHARVVGTATTAVWVLQGAVVLVLLIACANLSTLLLSRAETRRREFAVRSALGATFGRLLQQSVAEGCLLSAAGGTLGLGVAVGSLRALVAAFPESLPRSGHIAIDWRVLVFTLGVAVATGVIFGIAPLLHLGSESTAPALKEGSQRATSGRNLLRRSLVVGEVALAVALVVGAGLLIRTVGNLTSVDAGFDRSHLVTFAISLPVAKYTTPVDRRQFHQRLMDQLGGAPGVTSLAAMTGLPPLRQVDANTTTFENDTPAPNQPSQEVDYYQAITTGYLDTMGIPVVEGRAFSDSDIDGPPVVMINQTMARTFWPGQNPIGRRLRPCCNPATPWMTIVGILRDVKQGGVDKKTGTELYFHAGRNAAATMNIVIRTPLAAGALAGTIHRAVAGLDPTVPVVGLRGMDEVFGEAIGRPRLLSQLLAIFASLALLLSTIGIYGVLSYMVAERRREIGIRVALGATRQSVLRMVLGQGFRLTSAGLAIGLVIALASGRLISSLLFGVNASDPLTMAGVVALISVVAFIACYLPGHAATRVDPIVALRAE